MDGLLLAVLLASFLGSPHCAGMCGGLVALVAGGGGERPGLRSAAQGQFPYQGGRLLAYLLIGAGSGAVGAVVDMGALSAGFERGAALFAGALMLAIGVGALLGRAGVPLPRLAAPRFVHGVLGRAMTRTRHMGPARRGAVLGLFTGLLPCGWLYAFAIVAAGTGAPHLGALAMAVFWLGSVPILAALGFGVGAALGPLRRHAPWLTALLLIAAGSWTIFGRAGLAGTLPRPGVAASDKNGAQSQNGALVAPLTPLCCEGSDDTVD